MRFDPLMDEGLWIAVEVLVDGDVMFDVQARLVVACELVVLDRQRFECWPIELPVGSVTAPRQPFKRAVQVIEQILDSGVDGVPPRGVTIA